MYLGQFKGMSLDQYTNTSVFFSLAPPLGVAVMYLLDESLLGSGVVSTSIFGYTDT
jgi:hypothetical protein